MILVTAAVLREGDRFFIARRAPGERLAGLWEFPGGKVDPGESPEVAMARELREELCIDATVGALLADVTHAEGPRPVRLLFYAITAFTGTIRLQDHDDARWVTAADMAHFEFAPADRPFVAQLMGPRGGTATPCT